MLKPSQKKELVEELRENLKASKIVLLTDFTGLNVVRLNDLRRKLKAAGITYKVVKNTLLIRAAENTDMAGLKDYFTGPTAIAMGFEDPVSPAKILTEFAKENDKLKIRAAALGGKVLDAEAIKGLSALPSREVLLGQLLSVMNAVPTSFVRALHNVPQKLVYALQAIKDQKEAA